MLDSFARKLIIPLLQSARSQQWLEKLHSFVLLGMNYGRGDWPRTGGEQAFIQSIVAPMFRTNSSMIAWDVGAGCGEYTELLAKYLPNESRILSFEPQVSAYQHLARRVEAEGFSNVTAFNLGFSDGLGAGTLYKSRDNRLLASLHLRKLDHLGICFDTTEQVVLSTIDKFCDEHGISRIDFLKLDVEGHEMAVLKGASNMLSRRRIGMIQWEFGGCNIDSRVFFRDFYYMLRDGYLLFRMLARGLHPVPSYHEKYEVFLTSNWCGISKELLESQIFRNELLKFAPILRTSATT